MPPATAPRIFRPHRHTAVLPMDGSERRCQRLQETFRRTASCRRADHGKSCRHFALVSRGHRSDRTPPRESPRHFAARMDESVIVGYYTSAEVHPRSPARLLLSKERKKPMARNDGIDRTFARNQDLPTLDDVAKVQEHNEREKDSYSNQDIDTTQTHRNVHFKKPTDSYAAMFDQMIADGVISTRGLKADAVKYGELLFDVNSAYFHNHGGYEYAKQFYADAYKAAVEIVGGEQYILSAVMHADERNRAMSEALGEDVYHYHLHVVYIPVVEKQILWSKRCKDEFLRGTVKETITQVSRSKKWESKPVLNEDGNPMLNAKGKKILKSSYSVLQDDFFNFMRAAGYTDVERGERGSTEEHLTVTQFKLQAEQHRLETVTGQVEQAEQSLADAKAATEKQKKKLEALQKETKAAKTIALTVQDIEEMGKKNALTGNVSLTPDQCDTLKRYAVNGIIANADNKRLKEKLASAEKTISIWKQRYEAVNEKYMELKQKAQPFLDAIEIASERVWAFVHAILARGKETQEHKHPMNKTVEEINKMIMEDAPMEEINDAIGYIDIYSCFDPIFEPPIDFLEECRKHWETAQSSFRKTIERKIGNTWYVIETECDGNEPLADKVKRLIFSDKGGIC